MKIENEDHAHIALILVLMRKLGADTFEMVQADFDEAIEHFFKDDKETGTVMIGYDDKTQKLSVTFPKEYAESELQ